MEQIEVWPFLETLAADDLRSVAIMVGASEAELSSVLSRDRLMAIVHEHVVLALGNGRLQGPGIEARLQSEVDRLWPGGEPLEQRVRARLVEGVGHVIRLGTLVASSDGVISRVERRFLTEAASLLGPAAADTLLPGIPRKAIGDVNAVLDRWEPAWQAWSSDQEAMRAALSVVAAVAVVDEVLRRPEIDTYYRIASGVGLDRKEAAILLEEVRRSYGQALPNVDPVAAGRLSVPTAAALSAAEGNGFGPFLSAHAGLSWLGTTLCAPHPGPGGRSLRSLPGTWPQWAGMLGALGLALAVSACRGPVRLDRLLPLLFFTLKAPAPALPPSSLQEFTTPPW